MKNINHPITDGNFLADFQKTEVYPLHKNDGSTDKSNCSPIRTISNRIFLKSTTTGTLTHWPLAPYPLTQGLLLYWLTKWLSSTYIKTKDQILNMFW